MKKLGWFFLGALSLLLAQILVALIVLARAHGLGTERLASPERLAHMRTALKSRRTSEPASFSAGVVPLFALSGYSCFVPR